MISAILPVLALALTAPVCASPAWREAVVALDAADEALIALMREAHASAEPEAGEAASERLGALRAFNNTFLLDTVTIECVRTMIHDDREAYVAYSGIVRHSFPESQSGPELIERVIQWNETLFAEGLIHAVTYGGLIDRHEYGLNSRQLYGSHMGCVDGEIGFDPPIHEPEALEARREAINWPAAMTDARLGEPCGG